MKSRVDHLSLFSSQSIELVCKRIANQAGDARKCLEICKSSLDFAELDQSEVKPKHINAAFQRSSQLRADHLLKTLSKNQKLVCRAISDEIKFKSQKLIPVSDIVRRVVEQKNMITFRDGLASIQQLINLKVLILKSGDHIQINSIISLAITEDEFFQIPL